MRGAWASLTQPFLWLVLDALICVIVCGLNSQQMKMRREWHGNSIDANTTFAREGLNMECFLASVSFWAAWRRIFGGLFGFPRPIIVVVGFIAASAPFYYIYGWHAALIAGGLAMLFWTPGHDFRKNSALWPRYGYIGAPWMLLERYEGTRPLGLGWTELSEYLAGALFGATLYAIIIMVNRLISVV